MIKPTDDNILAGCLFFLVLVLLLASGFGFMSFSKTLTAHVRCQDACAPERHRFIEDVCHCQSSIGWLIEDITK